MLSCENRMPRRHVEPMHCSGHRRCMYVNCTYHKSDTEIITNGVSKWCQWMRSACFESSQRVLVSIFVVFLISSHVHVDDMTIYHKHITHHKVCSTRLYVLMMLDFDCYSIVRNWMVDFYFIVRHWMWQIVSTDVFCFLCSAGIGLCCCCCCRWLKAKREVQIHPSQFTARSLWLRINILIPHRLAKTYRTWLALPPKNWLLCAPPTQIVINYFPPTKNLPIYSIAFDCKLHLHGMNS